MIAYWNGPADECAIAYCYGGASSALRGRVRDFPVRRMTVAMIFGLACATRLHGASSGDRCPPQTYGSFGGRSVFQFAIKNSPGTGWRADAIALSGSE